MEKSFFKILICFAVFINLFYFSFWPVMLSADSAYFIGEGKTCLSHKEVNTAGSHAWSPAGG